MAKDPLLEQTVPTEKMAKELSKILGCSGAHKVGDNWGPCESQRDLKKLIELGNPSFREWKKKQQRRSEKGVMFKQSNQKNSPKSRAEAERQAVSMGCNGAHMSSQGVWAPCRTPEEYNAARAHSNVGGSPVLRRAESSRRRFSRTGWEKLRERGPLGIETIDGGGLVSAKALMSDSFKPSKGMVVEANRGLEWRKEHRRGGTAVGVARARDIKNGRNLPYATVKRMKAFFDRHQSDSKAQGFRPGEQGFPSNGRIAHALWGGDAGYVWAKDIVKRVEGDKKDYSLDLSFKEGSDPKTPAKPSERVFGSSTNKPGSASSGKNNIELTPEIEAALKDKVKKHNDNMRKRNKPELVISSGTLKAVWRRGAGAFSTSHRPGMGRQQWAMGRVNAFLHLVSNGKPKNPKYVTDNDLLPKEHKRSSKKS